MPSATRDDPIARRIRVALGQEPGDLLLTGGRVVNVFTRPVEAADVVIADGRIAGVGRYAWEAARTIDLAGRTVIPGPDRRAHAPGEHAADPGRAGPPDRAEGDDGGDLRLARDRQRPRRPRHRPLAAAAEGLPLDLFFMASSCVPATAFEDAGAAIGPAQVLELLGRPHVLGLAEVMDIPAVLGGEPRRPGQDRRGPAAGHGGRRPRAGPASRGR